MLLGELLGNPKGTKSFSSWSEFTDFVNEMPIKTIQPFVSDFNAFAGEGFYGNVVQGLVIKQLEDVVFIFGIAIDGTLIFRKRNYPDVSTWEDPKIIIHSNNWHKIYSKRELGELIGNATSNKSGLMSSGMVPLELSKDNNQYCKISVFMPNAGSINESVISVTNVGGDSFSVAVSMIRWNANKVFCKLINGTKVSNINMYYTVDTDRFCFYIKANWYAKIVVSRLGLVNTSKIESINAIPSEAIEVPIYWRDKRYSTDLGGLLGVNETWFRDRGSIRGEINLDDFKDAGAYSLFNVEGNNVPTSWAQLLIFSSGYYITQIIIDISSRKLFIRRYDIENDRWQGWNNIIMT